MPEIKFEKEWLDSALNQCAAELTDMLKSEQAALAKSATDDAPAEESEGSEGPASPPPSDEGEASASPEASAPEAGEASAPDDASPPAEASAPPAEASAAPGEEQAIEPAPTPEALQAEYAKLDPESLKMHYLAAKAALAAIMGADASAGAPPEASASPAAPPAAPPAPPAAAPMAMGEMKAGKQVNLTDGNGGEVEAGKLGKSEKDAEIALLKAQLDEQNKALLQLAEVVATPIRKSIKGLSDLKFIERSEEVKPSKAATLSKKEVQAVLKEKVRAGKLSKADKELVMQYSVGAVDIAKIEHLLADAK